jgi:peptide/nickel transport system substrate-binding protein
MVLVAGVLAIRAVVATHQPKPPAAEEHGARHGGTIVASIRAEPRSFNRYTARDLSTTVITYLMHSGLVRVNRVTNQIEPDLAERWELLEDRRTYRLHLRPNVRFSDGVPFSSADVVFSFAAIYDPKAESVLADSLQVRGKPLTVTAEDGLTVTIAFPTPFGAGLRMLDGVPIYPKHRLGAALAGGAFRRAWGSATPPSELAGLGPFVLRQYEPGQRLTFDRNPHFRGQASGLPNADRMVLEIVPDQDTELLQLDNGAIDLTQSELRPGDLAALKRANGAGRVALSDAGIGLDGDLLWINLTESRSRDPRARWLQSADFRRALAHSVDRRVFVDTVYLGEAAIADSIVSPGNAAWHVPAPAPGFDPAAARQLLAGLGLSHRDGNGKLRDGHGDPVRFSLLTQKGNTSLERGAAVLRESFVAVGLDVDVVALEVGSLIDHVMRGDYDAAYFGLVTTDSDPALNLDFWLSSGGAHIWNPEQHLPATAWEREIDRLMDRVSTSLDPRQRHAAFETVQRIMAREVPALCFAFPRQHIAVSSRIANATPAAFRPTLLWNPAALGVRSAR